MDYSSTARKFSEFVGHLVLEVLCLRTRAGEPLVCCEGGWHGKGVRQATATLTRMPFRMQWIVFRNARGWEGEVSKRNILSFFIGLVVACVTSTIFDIFISGSRSLSDITPSRFVLLFLAYAIGFASFQLLRSRD